MTVRYQDRRKARVKRTMAAVQKNEGFQLELTAFLPRREQLGIEIVTVGNSIRK
jgi:hypothetical protein